jgi:hypothetical protein
MTDEVFQMPLTLFKLVFDAVVKDPAYSGNDPHFVAAAVQDAFCDAIIKVTQ